MTEYPDLGIAVCTPDRRRAGMVSMPDREVEPMMGRTVDRRDA